MCFSCPFVQHWHLSSSWHLHPYSNDASNASCFLFPHISHMFSLSELTAELPHVNLAIICISFHVHCSVRCVRVCVLSHFLNLQSLSCIASSLLPHPSPFHSLLHSDISLSSLGLLLLRTALYYIISWWWWWWVVSCARAALSWTLEQKLLETVKAAFIIFCCLSPTPYYYIHAGKHISRLRI